MRIGQEFRKGIRVLGIAIAGALADLNTVIPTITSGSGAPSAVEPSGSVYMRTGQAAGTVLYVRTATPAWVAVSASAISGTDFGAGGLATDVVSESTAAAGVTIDGLLLKDNRIDASPDATGVAGITLADNLASAFDVKEGSNVYLTFVTTNSSEAIAATRRLTTTDGVTAGTARIVGGLAAVNPAASTAITGTTETQNDFSTGAYTIPANTLKVGTVVKVRARGLYTAATGAETHVLGVAVAGTAIASSGAIDPAANDLFDIEFVFTCRAVGGSGTITGSGRVLSGPRATAAPALHLIGTGSGATSTATVDTTAALALSVFLDRQATATDGDSMRLDSFTVEIIG
jgi:hypothetical protein